MAITTNSHYTGTISDAHYKQNETTIKGSCLSVEKVVPDYLYDNIKETTGNNEKVKRELITALVERMYDLDMIEFTKSENVISGVYIFKARIFVVPDSQVRLLRVNGVIE